MTRALVIGRHRNGRPIEHAVRETRHRLEGAGWTVESAVVDRKRQLRKHAARAVKDEVDVVVAVGGDGAVLQVVQVLAETEVALGIIPLGTGNLLAGNLGIPHRLDRAIEVLMGGGRRRIDLGRLTIGEKHRHFSVACGIGFDAEVMEATETKQKDRWGKLAYVASAIRQSRRVSDVTHQVSIDGIESSMEATQIFIANFGRMGLAMKPRLNIEPDDGVLDVIVLRASGRLPGLLAGWEALRQGDEGESTGGRAYRAKAHEVRIDSEPSRLVEIDGSVVGATPIDVSVRPAALTVVIPKT
jgi:YegS/Rv2252/BmrU family lipid kinase